MAVRIHLGVVWVVIMGSGWFRHIKAFPQAVDKAGEPKLDHADVIKYLKDST